jgi:hypothetical protein
MSQPITFLADADMQQQHKAVAARRLPNPGPYETWKPFHERLCAVAGRYGRVSDSPDPQPDFYYSGDWFHELTDGFALLTTEVISVEALREFQKVVSAHHPDANVSLGGDGGTRIFGLEILITSPAIFVAWSGRSAAECRDELRKLEVNLECIRLSNHQMQ